MCSSLKFISEESHLNLVFCVLNFEHFELLTWYTTTVHCFLILKCFGNRAPNVSHVWRSTIKVDLHLRRLLAETFQNNETVKGGCIPS